MKTEDDVDTVVVGGGVVGTSLAYGLARTGQRVRLLDEGDDAYRAARGNFGLVWVQGKGLTQPAYARWTLQAARCWPALAAELLARTGTDVELRQPGGLTMCLSEPELQERAAAMAGLRAQLGGEYPYRVLDGAQVRQLIPQTGPEVVGAIQGLLDGHANPLRLLRALLQGYQSLGGELAAGARVQSIEHRHGGFVVHAGGRSHGCGRVVLAAGLGNRDLAPLVGLEAPVRPNRGQILVTERLQPFLDYPTLYVRQTGEGVVQIGDSKEDVGLDDSTTLLQLSQIAARALKCFPLLAGVNIVRTWGALRVMSPDGLPIYEASSSCPGAFVVTCHSGVTLAGQHAGPLVDWILGRSTPPELGCFNVQRFAGLHDVPAH